MKMVKNEKAQKTKTKTKTEENEKAQKDKNQNKNRRNHRLRTCLRVDIADLYTEKLCLWCVPADSSSVF